MPQLTGLAGMDLEPINAAIRAQGSAEVDVILGLEVFDPHVAVIDYHNLSLFFRVIAADPMAEFHRGRQ